MRIFSEEPVKGKKDCGVVLILSRLESQNLYSMVETACKASPRKKTYRNFLEELDKWLCVY